MKLWQLFIVLALAAPLYLSAAETAQTADSPQTAAENPATAETQTPAVAAEAQNQNADANTNAAVNQNAAAAQDTAPQPPVQKNITDFPNTADGAKSFVAYMLESVYTELPNKANNQDVFVYLSQITNEYFAFSYMATWTIGRDVIKDVPEDQQQRYLVLAKEFMVLLYGEIFNTYYKQYTYTLGEVDQKSGNQFDVKMFVEPKIKDAKNQDTLLNVVWKVKYSTQENRFYIINVDVNGVLLLSSQQKQFKDMLRSQGNDFAKFLDVLGAKNMETKARLGVFFP
ncbi:MAG: ABC transporter substrate-binding protein [Alphaproteobacteria bacterium]|nr:ABC transporter substrate-binding protein [Alphaproteobacteria bacterium]